MGSDGQNLFRIWLHLIAVMVSVNVLALLYPDQKPHTGWWIVFFCSAAAWSLVWMGLRLTHIFLRPLTWRWAVKTHAVVFLIIAMLASMAVIIIRG